MLVRPNESVLPVLRKQPVPAVAKYHGWWRFLKAMEREQRQPMVCVILNDWVLSGNDAVLRWCFERRQRSGRVQRLVMMTAVEGDDADEVAHSGPRSS